MVKKTTAKDGDHVVTMREVAKAAGVSIKTVSNVVNDYEFVSDATRAKVHKAIDELGYVINVSARNLRRGSTGIIALAIPDLQLSYFAQLSSLIITEAKKLGLRVIVEPTLYSREGELDALHGGLRLHLTLDDRDVVGTTAYDSAGPPFHDGTIRNGPTQIVGRVGEALGFNGTNANIGLGNPAALNFAGRITMAAWVRPLATDGLRATSRGRLLLRIIAMCFDRYLPTTAASTPRFSRTV